MQIDGFLLARRHRMKGRNKVDAVGIVAEFNPFHHGHAYLLEQAKKQSQAELIVVAMSGNFLQRGEVAFIDKWTRAKMACEKGADLVLEIPFVFACQSADIFAKAGVHILKAAACSKLAFASESGSSQAFMRWGRLLAQYENEIQNELKKEKNYHKTYAQQMSDLIHSKWSDCSSPLDFSEPNNLLALLYCRENYKSPHPMSIYRIQRQQAHHHDKKIQAGQNFASASAIRQTIAEGEDQSVLEHVMDPHHLDVILSRSTLNWSKVWPYLHYQIISQDSSSLNKIYQMTEGLEYRLLDKIQANQSFYDYMQAIKTKRYSWTRLQRLLIYILVQLSKDTMNQAFQDGITGVRILAMTQAGQSYLNQLKKNDSTLQWVSNLNKKNKELFAMDIKVGRLYQFFHSDSIESQDFFRYPYFYKK